MISSETLTIHKVAITQNKKLVTRVSFKIFIASVDDPPAYISQYFHVRENTEKNYQLCWLFSILEVCFAIAVQNIIQNPLQDKSWHPYNRSHSGP